MLSAEPERTWSPRTRAVLLDFDGLIMDTESCLLRSWAEEYERVGLPFSLADWRRDFGSDPGHHRRLVAISEQLSAAFDVEACRERRWQRHQELAAAEAAAPGVREFLEWAVVRGLASAVVSSSPRSWVVPHLDRLGLLAGFDVVCTGDEVRNRKPAPDLFLLALDRLGLWAEEAVAFEDSSVGLAAATAAGVPCVVVPNPVTRMQDFTRARYVAESFADPAVRAVVGCSPAARTVRWVPDGAPNETRDFIGCEAELVVQALPGTVRQESG
jgi:HAD superfamily hydrolase (TIGR01509 family)